METSSTAGTFKHDTNTSHLFSMVTTLCICCARAKVSATLAAAAAAAAKGAFRRPLFLLARAPKPLKPRTLSAISQCETTVACLAARRPALVRWALSAASPALCARSLHILPPRSILPSTIAAAAPSTTGGQAAAASKDGRLLLLSDPSHALVL